MKVRNQHTYLFISILNIVNYKNERKKLVFILHPQKLRYYLTPKRKGKITLLNVHK